MSIIIRSVILLFAISLPINPENNFLGVSVRFGIN
jgi:hypothetical protein